MDVQFTAVFTAGIAALALVGAVLVGGPSRRRGLALGALVALHFAVGVWVIRHVQGIFIDVDVFQRQSVEALRHGINPYAITFPNIYTHERFYAPGVSINGQLQFGYPYFPLSLLAVLPGTLLTGDHRYTALIAMELAAILMACSRPNAFGGLAAVLYLTTPREFYMLEQSWTEPIVVLGLAAVVYAACRNQRMVPWLFGAFIALKQYLVLALPAAVLLAQPRGDRRALIRLFGVAAAVGAAVTVPFLIWDPAAFVKSVVTLQFRQPFRPEALSFLAWWTTSGHPQPSVAIAFGVTAVVSAVAVWRLPRTAAGFSAALAATLFVFFAFNKQAFCNYYFFVIGALCVTLAACTGSRQEAPVAQASSPAPASRFRPITLAGWTALGTVVMAALIPLLWIGDMPFINDEPLLIGAAVQANALGRLADLGLMGTFGFAYGPFPTWVYQILTSLSHDLVVVAFLHTALVVSATAFSLWWLSRSLGLWVWFAPVPLLSPYFWFDARLLWDNPFLIPLGALSIAGYAAHLHSGSKAGLRVALSAMACIPLVHLSGLAFVVPLGAHMVLVRWRSLWTERASVTAVVATAGVAAWPYWLYLLSAQAPSAGSMAGLRGWLFPLLGGRVLSARELQYFFGPGPVHGRALQMAATVSWLAYVLVWTGIGVSVWQALRARTRQATPRTHIGVILLGTLVCQMALDGYAGKFLHPQYYNATWMTFTVLAWMAVDWLAMRRGALRWTAPAATGILATTLLFTVATLAIRLHHTSGTREVYGPTLANQPRVARDLARYAPHNPVSTDVVPYQLYPHALETLRQLSTPRYESRRTGDLEVRYASSDPASGAIALVER